MSRGIVAQVENTVNAPVEAVWSGLVDPAKVQKYMLGAKVVSEWKEGSSIVWKGDWKGKPYEDKGKILKLEANKLFEYTHYSPLSGAPDVPDSYHTVRISLTPAGDKTKVILSQDNNKDDEARKHSEQNWKTMLEGLKKTVES